MGRHPVVAPLDSPLACPVLREHLIAREQTFVEDVTRYEWRPIGIFDSRDDAAFPFGFAQPAVEYDPTIAVVVVEPGTSAEQEPEVWRCFVVSQMCSTD